ncbi:MAG: outer membrane lipoprotein carrier protein LolA [Bacteroidales bacterium]|nr:outer membrane lipoprotein carrier protein LolA [Bacteroidales bacterium]
MKKTIVLSIALFFGFISISNAQVDDVKAREILNKVSAKAKVYKNMKFDFTYRMVDKAHDIDESLKGTVTLEGDKYKLIFLGRTIISDAKTVWSFDPDAEEIQISNVSKDADAFNPGKLLTSYDESYRSKLIKTKKEDGKEYYIIDLYPKKGKSFFKIRLKIDKSKLQVVSGTVYGKDNVTYTYSIDTFATNVATADGFFTMNVNEYPDADVVDLR